jgi:hypothetical protein
VLPKSPNTIPIVERYVRDQLIKRFGENMIFWKCLKGNGGDDETRTSDLCRDS